MTKGNILGNITKFAIPCILTRIIQNLYPLIDSFIVGKLLSLDGLAAVGVAGSLYSLFNDTFSNLVLGFSIVVSNKYGAKNAQEVNSAFSNSFIASVIVSIVVSTLGFFFSSEMFSALNTPLHLIKYAQEYITVLFLGFIINIIFNFLCEMLRAIGDSKTPLILLLISLLIHLISLFPLTAIYGIRGAALSTVISYIITVILATFYIYKKYPEFRISLFKFKIHTNILKECFEIGIPMALTSFVVALGVLVLSFITNNIGSEYIAAYSCASKIGYIITTPIFGFSNALAVFTSQNFGAKNLKRIKEGIAKTIKFVLLLNVFIIILSLIFSKPILMFILDKSNIAVNAGMLYLFIRCFSMFLLTPAAIYKSVLPALGKPFFSTVSGFLEIGVRFVFPFLLSNKLGFSVVPLTDTFSWLFLAVLLTLAYFYEFKKIYKKGNILYEK